MTINSPAAILLAFYACVGEEQGVPREKLRGTIQTDILIVRPSSVSAAARNTVSS